MVKATVYSVYMANISASVVRAQRECVEQFLPSGWTFKQVGKGTLHPAMLRECVEENREEYTIFLDIDAIPLTPMSFTYLFDTRWSVTSGALVGAAQRASHIVNGNHIYVGPFCMAFKNSVYWELGGPTFNDTYRGDVGEELTYAWQAKGKPVFFIYPSDVEKPLWNLLPDVQFGLGTTYEGLFYHMFCIRSGPDVQLRFIKKCKEVISAYNSKINEKAEVFE